VATVARIMADAEGTLDAVGNYGFMRNFTPKPLPTIEVGACCYTLLSCAIAMAELQNQKQNFSVMLNLLPKSKSEVGAQSAADPMCYSTHLACWQRSS
jgi:hypothetical protein